MNLITFGFSEKGTPVFLNQEPFQQVGTMYLMKAGENSVIGITLDDKVVKLAKAPGKVKRGRKAKAEMAEAMPQKRTTRKAMAKGATLAKRGRKTGKEVKEKLEEA
jgi:hypothetical protein